MRRSSELRTFFFLALLLTGNFISVLAQGYNIESFDVEIEISREGYFDVQETIVTYFSTEKRGIIRDIPTRYDLNGEEVTINITNIRTPGHQYKVNKSGGGVSIRIGDPDKYLRGRQTYEINYRVYRAFVFADDHTEFYWSMLGDQWDTDILQASYRIVLPDDLLVYDEDMVVWAGISGTQAKFATISKTGKVISGNATTTLGRGKDMTVAINLPADYISRQATDQAGENGSITEEEKTPDYTYPIPLALMALLFGAYRKHGFVASKDEEIQEQYYPPEGMSPAEVGTFYDYVANDRDLISLIPLWGNEGYVEVRAIENHDGGSDLYFYKLKDLDKDVPEYEREFFDGLFADGDQVFLADLKNKFYTTMSSSRNTLNKQVRGYRLYDTRSKTYFKSFWSVLFMLASLAGGIAVMVAWGMIYTGIALILLAIMILVFLVRRPKLTEEGKSLHDQMVGLYKFLKQPSEEKIQKLMQEDQNYLNYIFPYVVAFGLDQKWNKEIIKYDIPEYSPTWYHPIYADGRTHRQASFADFSKTFNVKSINSVFTSAPASSSGSSGGFSGGSSGGGFGGGGGSSW